MRRHTFCNLLTRVVTQFSFDASDIVLPGPPAGRSDRQSPAGAHVHDSWELQVPLAGRLAFRVPGGEAGWVPRGGVLLMPPNRVHVRYDHPTLRHPKSLRYLGLTLDYGNTYLAHVVVRNRKTDHHYLTADEREAWNARLLSLPGEVLHGAARAREQTSGGTVDAYVSGLLRHLFGSLALVLSEQPEPSLGAPERAVRKAQEFMSRRYMDPDLDLRRIAACVGLSSTYLAGIFKQVTGQTIRQHLIGLRMRRAEALLRSGRFSVKEVASLTGWRNQLYFSTAFRRHFGLPPSHLKGADTG